MIGERMTPKQAEEKAAQWAASGRTAEVVDAAKMLLIVVVQETEDGRAEMRAQAPNCDKVTAAAILRQVADQWDPDRTGTVEVLRRG
jgi:hypothetical protein